ncbi:MAG: hypothetical protein HQK60_04460 [Deltaproteobacteria bacterium]|nr:hypothetical protein [Deltaproteobacteria bacterium]
MHYYAAYGLNISSEITCPELVETCELEPDVIIRSGAVPPRLAEVTTTGHRFQAGPNQILIQTRIIADILVAAGREITVAPNWVASDGNVLLICGWPNMTTTSPQKRSNRSIFLIPRSVTIPNSGLPSLAAALRHFQEKNKLENARSLGKPPE